MNNNILLLDFDNTLVNTLCEYRKAHNKLLNQNISQPIWDNLTQGLNVNQIADVLDNHFGIGDKQVYIEKSRNVARQQILNKAPNDNIIRLIKSFKGPIYILSGNDTNLIRKYISKWKIPIKLNNVIGESSANDKKIYIDRLLNKGYKVVMVDDNYSFIRDIRYKCGAIHYNGQGIVNIVNNYLKYYSK